MASGSVNPHHQAPPLQWSMNLAATEPNEANNETNKNLIIIPAD